MMGIRTAALGCALAGGLAWATTGCTPAPAVSVTPATGLVDGQEVTVTGSGYSPGASLGIVQCPAGAESIDRCDGDTAVSFSADGAGGYTRRTTVVAEVVDAHGVATDCTAAAGACVIASVYVHGFQGLATAELAFA